MALSVHLRHDSYNFSLFRKNMTCAGFMTREDAAGCLHSVSTRLPGLKEDHAERFSFFLAQSETHIFLGSSPWCHVSRDQAITPPVHASYSTIWYHDLDQHSRTAWTSSYEPFCLRQGKINAAIIRELDFALHDHYSNLHSNVLHYSRTEYVQTQRLYRR